MYFTISIQLKIDVISI